MSNNRFYNGTDAYMAESARTIHQLLTADVAQFSAFSSRFNAAYLDDFLAKIDAADAVITDEPVLSQQITKTITTLPYEAARFISFENKGVVPLVFDIAPESTANDAAALVGNVVDLGGGAVVNQTMAWLNGDIAEGTAVKIIAYNASATETGAYEVSINIE